MGKREMKLSERLSACAALVRPGSIPADIGTDHGHVPIYLVANGICPRAIAADLRQGPLSAARRNADLAGVTDRIDFYLSDGLKEIPAGACDTVICAGMGGDTIISILSGAGWIRDGEISLILQPQSAVAELRAFLWEEGFSIQRERFAEDGKFVYTVMEVHFGRMRENIPASFHLPVNPEKNTAYEHYMARLRHSLEKSVSGLQQAKNADPERLREFEAALAALEEIAI